MDDSPSRAAAPATPRGGLRSAGEQVGSLLVFAIVPAALVATFTIGVIGKNYGFDFHTFWQASRLLLHGHSPYPSAIPKVAPADGRYEFFVYPPPFAAALAPLAALPFDAAAAVWTVLLIGCIGGSLRLLGASDWRCYGVAFASIPVLSSLRLGAVTPLLLLALAIAWRHRDRWPIVGASVGAAIVVKPFLWPVLLWLVLTRRWKATAGATIGGVALTLVTWAAIGFRGLTDYPELLRNVTRLEGTRGYSFVAVADRLHLPDPSLSWLALSVPVAVLLLAVNLVRPPARDLDRGLYCACIEIALVLTPILWLHYFALLLAPAVLLRSTLGVEWALPLAFWLSSFQEPMRHPLWRLALVLALVVVWAGVAWRSAAPERPLRRRAEEFA